jgi:hypothetical protein
MTYLADFIGQLAASITNARLQADLEAVRVAELYSSHPLLRHFPVPHFRLPDVEITAPVLIHESEEPAADNTVEDMLKPEEIQSVSESVLASYLKRNQIQLDNNQLSSLKQAISSRLKDANRVEKLATDVGHISRLLSTGIAEELSNVSDTVKIEKQKSLRDINIALKIELLNRRRIPSSLKVIVESAKIKEVGKQDLLVNVKMKFSEDAMEWTMVDIDGEETDRLTPE